MPLGSMNYARGYPPEKTGSKLITSHGMSGDFYYERE